MVRRSALPTLGEDRAVLFRLWILHLRLREFFVGFCEWLSARCCGMASVPGNAQKRGEMTMTKGNARELQMDLARCAGSA